MLFFNNFVVCQPVLECHEEVIVCLKDPDSQVKFFMCYKWYI